MASRPVVESIRLLAAAVVVVTTCMLLRPCDCLTIEAAEGARSALQPGQQLESRFASQFNASAFDNPFYTSLRDPSTGRHICAATLVHNKIVVTAAHCVDPAFNGSVPAPTAVVGALGSTQAQDVPSVTQTRSTVRTVLHPNWNGDLLKGSDIALVILDASVGRPTALLNSAPVEGELFSIGVEAQAQAGGATGGNLSSECNVQAILDDDLPTRAACVDAATQTICVKDAGAPLLADNDRFGRSRTLARPQLVGVLSFVECSTGVMVFANANKILTIFEDVKVQLES